MDSQGYGVKGLVQPSKQSGRQGGKASIGHKTSMSSFVEVNLFGQSIGYVTYLL